MLGVTVDFERVDLEDPDPKEICLVRRISTKSNIIFRYERTASVLTPATSKRALPSSLPSTAVTASRPPVHCHSPRVPTSLNRLLPSLLLLCVISKYRNVSYRHRKHVNRTAYTQPLQEQMSSVSQEKISLIFYSSRLHHIVQRLFQSVYRVDVSYL